MVEWHCQGQTETMEEKILNIKNMSSYLTENGARGGAVGWGTATQTRRSRVRFATVSLEFFIDIIPPAALWPWGWLSL